MSVEYVYVSNNLYNSARVKPVKWGNKLIGFPGETVRARVSLNVDNHSDEMYLIAKKEFETYGMHEEIMGRRF